MVARVALHNMRQDRDETVRSYGARLRGQADICKFLIKCPGCDANVNYTDAIMRDVLTRGISDPEIQLDLLGNKNQDMMLKRCSSSSKPKKPANDPPPLSWTLTPQWTRLAAPTGKPRWQPLRRNRTFVVTAAGEGTGRVPRQRPTNSVPSIWTTNAHIVIGRITLRACAAAWTNLNAHRLVPQMIPKGLSLMPSALATLQKRPIMDQPSPWTTTSMTTSPIRGWRDGHRPSLSLAWPSGSCLMTALPSV